MQSARLFEIIYLLLNRGSVTASKLAERFEVSVRTIYRDVDALSAAGIPVYTTKGRGGGIHLSESFVLNKSLLSESEQGEILAALQGLDATRFSNGAALIKLGGLFQKSVDWIEIDFSSWETNDRDTFELIRRAILNRRRLMFDYYSSAGELTRRSAEPLLLWFKHRGWYLKAYCLARRSERLFKLSRMKRVALLDETFDARSDAIHTGREALSAPVITVRLKIDASQMYRIFDEFDSSMVEMCDDGSYICEAAFPEDEWVYGYILSFGPHAQVLEPAHVRDLIGERLKIMVSKYF